METQSEFLEIFRDEATERLDRIVTTLVALEAGTAPPEAVDSLFRDMHTIKGAAGMVGRDDVHDLAHALEDVLADARTEGSFDPRLADPLLRAADALRLRVEGTGESAAEPIAALRSSVTTLAAPAEAIPVSEPASETRPERRSIRVAPEKIDSLLELVGETVLHQRRLEHTLGGTARGGERLVADELDVGGRLVDELKDAAIAMRTLPLASIVGTLPRAVRDLAAETGKDVGLVLDGTDTELDRAILDGLAELLVHLLRNSVAHGIEPPDERERAGKPRSGRVAVRAEQRGGDVEVTVSDDGRGVSEETLAEAGRAGSLVAVLARAGFSTATEVSGISGRGVGLDAVKKQVESFGGNLDVRSRPGLGTDVVLRLPLALALVEVLLVERAGSIYGLPLTSVEEVISVRETLSLGGRPAVELRGSAVRLADLAELVGANAPPPAPGAPAIVLALDGRRLAASCDALLGEEEVVVKSLGSFLGSIPTYLGAAILGDGRIALLVDPVVLVDAAARRGVGGSAPAPAAATLRDLTPAASPRSVPTVLVVEDSLAVRELQRSILEAAGYHVETARDGREALDRLGREEPVELVVTDVDMPFMDGFALTAAIRAHPTHSALPVVVVTSRGEEDDRRRGIEAGADAYMVKRGFDQNVLLETVERLVGR